MRQELPYILPASLPIEEFPKFDVDREVLSPSHYRLHPLAELVKIDPKSIGVGQYQHDMNQKHLSEALGNVVEDRVNKVGVDLNDARPHLFRVYFRYLQGDREEHH